MKQIAAIYARVSTKDQSCEMQVKELRDFAERSGWKVEEYVDLGFSGSARSRPALDRLLKGARLKKFGIVLVWKLDRFGRSLQQVTENVRLLTSLGIRFVVPSQGIDTDERSPIGKFLVHIFASFAEFEHDLITDRINSGVAEAKRRGQHCGRPFVKFAIDKAVALRMEGLSWRAIAWRFGGRVSMTTIRKRVGKAMSKELALTA